MASAELKVIIDKGADFILEVQVYDGVIPRDMSSQTVTVSMVIKYDDNGIQILDTVVGTIVDAANGKVKIVIDKVVTATYPTRITDVGIFSTEYNYIYHIDINTVETGEDLRILRGKCAIRE